MAAQAPEPEISAGRPSPGYQRVASQAGLPYGGEMRAVGSLDDRGFGAAPNGQPMLACQCVLICHNVSARARNGEPLGRPDTPEASRRAGNRACSPCSGDRGEAVDDAAKGLPSSPMRGETRVNINPLQPSVARRRAGTASGVGMATAPGGRAPGAVGPMGQGPRDQALIRPRSGRAIRASAAPDARSDPRPVPRSPAAVPVRPAPHRGRRCR